MRAPSRHSAATVPAGIAFAMVVVALGAVLAAWAYTAILLPVFLAALISLGQAARAARHSGHAARHDPLTGSLNRLAFREAVRAALTDPTAGACLLLLDLDRFKEVNDSLGHHHGDELLRQVAARIRSHLQSRDRLARLGGDEFAVLLPGATPPAALAVAHAIVEALSSPFALAESVVGTGVSVGVARYPTDADDVEALLHRADVAMYQAKQARAGVALYDERDDDHSPATLALIADLRRAVGGGGEGPPSSGGPRGRGPHLGAEAAGADARGEIELVYQPVVDLAAGRVSTMEAQVRWRHPRLGMLSPAEFLPLAERTNLTPALTRLVLDQALAQLNEWTARGLDLAVSVDISARALADPAFVPTVTHALASEGVDPLRLTLEVTERAVMADPDRARSVLRALGRTGIDIAIDHYGTGHSSLASLIDLPVTQIKIDRTFVATMAPGSRESVIVTSTIDLAHHLGMRVVAEGVEDRSALSELGRLDCDLAQGSAIGRAMSAPEATAWLQQEPAVPAMA